MSNEFFYVCTAVDYNWNDPTFPNVGKYYGQVRVSFSGKYVYPNQGGADKWFAHTHFITNPGIYIWGPLNNWRLLRSQQRYSNVEGCIVTSTSPATIHRLSGTTASVTNRGYNPPGYVSWTYRVDQTKEPDRDAIYNWSSTNNYAAWLHSYNGTGLSCITPDYPSEPGFNISVPAGNRCAVNFNGEVVWYNQTPAYKTFSLGYLVLYRNR